MPESAKPLFIELFAGLHGWGEGAVAEGFRVVGFDIADMCAAMGRKRPDGIDLVLQDVRTIHGSQLRHAAVICASPPCQEFSRYAMPFGALWEEHDRMDDDGSPPGNYLHKPCPSTYLFWTCFRIQQEASEAAGHYIPMIVENVRGAQRFVGRSQWNYGSFHLYGDVPALMPMTLKRPNKNGAAGGSWFPLWNGATLQGNHGRDGIKQLHSRGDNKSWGAHRMGLGSEGQKGTGAFPNRGWTAGCAITLGLENYTGTKQPGGSGDWFSKDARADGSSAKYGSKSSARKQASAQIAKIPLPLAQHIASVYKPRPSRQAV